MLLNTNININPSNFTSATSVTLNPLNSTITRYAKNEVTCLISKVSISVKLLLIA